MLSPEELAAIALYDQIGSALARFAQVLAQYRRELVLHGFTDAEAFALCRDYQEMWIELTGGRER